MNIDKHVAMNSSSFFGFLILRVLKKNKKSTIYDLYNDINEKNAVTSRQFTIGLLYLFTVGLVDFSEAHIWLIK